jgi:hypothetical protein
MGSACFAYIASTAFARNIYAICCLLGISHRSGSHECVPKCVLVSEYLLYFAAVPNPLELIRDTLHRGDDH